MVIGRTDERNTPGHPTAHDAADVLRGSLAQTIWAAVMTPHRKAGHMTALVPTTNFLHIAPLNLKGRPHMDGGPAPAMTGDSGKYSMIMIFGIPLRCCSASCCSA